MGIAKKEGATSLTPLINALKRLKEQSGGNIDRLLNLLEVFSGRETEVLRQWCTNELIANEFKITPLVEALYTNIENTARRPVIYYFITLLKKAPNQSDAIKNILLEHGGWPDDENVLLRHLGDILASMVQGTERKVANSIINQISGESVTPDNRDALIQKYFRPRVTANQIPMRLAKELDKLNRAKDSTEDQRICGIILALSQSREHILDDLSRLCAIEFEASPDKNNQIMQTFAKNLRELSPKPAILYALYFFNNTQSKEMQKRIQHAIHLLANWPYDLQKFTAQIGKIFKDALESDKELIDKMASEFDSVNKNDAANWLHSRFPSKIIKPPLKFPAPSIRSQAKRVNDHITRQLRNLLEELGSEFVKIDWALDLKDTADVAAFREVINSVTHLRLTSEIIAELGKRKLSLRSAKLPEEAVNDIAECLKEQGFSVKVEDQCVVIDSIGKLNEAEEIINNQKIAQRKMPSAQQKTSIAEIEFNATQFIAEHANFMNNVDTARQMSTAALAQIPDLQDVFINVDDAAEKSTGMLQQVFAGIILVAKIQQDKLEAEDLSIYCINAVESGLDIFRQFSPELFKATFKKTPFGPIFIAGRQLVNELFFARDWQQGRDKHHEIRFSVGERCQYFAKLYQAIYAFIISQIRKKVEQLQKLPGMENADIQLLLENHSSQPTDVQKLLTEINRLSNSITTAKNSIEALIKETRREASRMNTEQQVLMTAKHIDRAFNAVMIGLGVGSVFVPVLGIPAAALALAKGVSDKTVKAKIKSAVEIVQGIYQTDNTIRLTKKTVKQAIKKMENITDVVLQYSPPVIEAFKLTRSLAKTAIEIRNHPEYILHIPDALRYKQLDSYAKPGEIQEQIEAFILTCQQFQYHMQIILGQTDIFLDDPDAYRKSHQTPRIHNIGAMVALIRDWSENLKQRMRDQRFTPDSKFYSDNFTQTKQAKIESMASLANIYFDNYQHQLHEQKVDPAFLRKLRYSIEDEISTLEQILSKAGNKNILNGNAIILRLQNRLNNLIELSRITPEIAAIYENRHKTLQDRINAVKAILTEKNLSQPMQISQKHLQHAKLEPEKIPLNELSLNIAPGVKTTSRPSISVPVHHYRRFESRRVANEALSRQLSSKASTDYTELYLLPVDKVTERYLDQAGFWKNIWLIRGINRALEFVENIAKRVSVAGPHIIPMNISDVLNDYKNQLELIRGHDHTHLSKFGSKIIISQAAKSIETINRLINTLPIPHPQKHMDS